jgi:hypothetical protein
MMPVPNWILGRGMFAWALKDTWTTDGPGTIGDVRLDLILAHGFV